jgi:hypothetical protein
MKSKDNDFPEFKWIWLDYPIWSKTKVLLQSQRNQDMMNFSFSIMSINRWILIIKGNNSVFNSDITMIWLDSVLTELTEHKKDHDMTIWRGKPRSLITPITNIPKEFLSFPLVHARLKWGRSWDWAQADSN